jgi:hypothetical protein
MKKTYGLHGVSDGWQNATGGWQSGGGRRFRTRRNKEAKLMAEEFPALGATTAPSVVVGSEYAAALKTEEPKAMEEERVEPGWVIFKRNSTTGRSERRGEPPIDPDADYEQRRDVALKHLVDKWQRDRDQITDVLDQTSPYWGVKDLRAPLSSEDLSESESECESESENESDYEYFSDGVGWASN